MSLLLLTWGGDITNSWTPGTPIEIWSNSLALIGPSSPDPSSYNSAVADLIATWFDDAAIDKSVTLRWMKLNEFQAASPFHQITDPTNELDFSSDPVHHGSGVITNPLPITSALRVSVDDGTRNRRARGGFYIPRPAIGVEQNGRIDPVAADNLVASAKEFLDGLNAISGLTPGVWSRRDGAVTAISRVRVGDLPDNMRSRRDALRENYYVRTLA